VTEKVAAQAPQERLGRLILVLGAIFPRSFFGVLGRVFGALALFALLQNATQFGLSVVFRQIIDVYLVAITATIGLFDPLVVWIISKFNDWFGWNITFAEGWRHIFLILQILFVRDAGTAISDGRRTLGFVRLLVGTIVAFVTAITAYLANFSMPILSNIVFSFIPLAGLLVYDIIMYGFSATMFFDAIGKGEVRGAQTRRQFFLDGLRRSFERFLIVAFGTIIVFILPAVHSLPFPHAGLIAMTAGLIANALYWLISGAKYALREQRKGEHFVQAFNGSESGRFGLAVSGIILWFLLFCAMNAGMRLLGF